MISGHTDPSTEYVIRFSSTKYCDCSIVIPFISIAIASDAGRTSVCTAHYTARRNGTTSSSNASTRSDMISHHCYKEFPR